jgi:Ice-binding-like
MKPTRRLILGIFFSILVVGVNSMVALASVAPGLGTAASYAILAGTTVTNTGNSVITGSVGISPGSACTGLPAPCTGGGPGTVAGGTINAGNAAAGQAQTDLTAAYGVAASSPCNSTSLAAWGGQTLTPGTYCQTTSPTISGTLTLSGNGVFIFKTGSTLVTAPGATIAFINGAQPCNVFWQVSSSATLDTTTTFVGTIMALTSITVNNGATIAGRLLARNGQVSLINDRITAPTTCLPTTVGGPTPAPTVSGAPAGGGGAPQGNGFPWILALVAGVLGSAGAVGLGLTIRGDRRRT